MYLRDEPPKPLGSFIDVVGGIIGSIFGLNKSDDSNSNDQAMLLLLQQQQAAQQLAAKNAQTTNYAIIAGVGVAAVIAVYLITKK
jgi:hypothetical protein